MSVSVSRKTLAMLLLPVLLAGCDAIYDDTKGWANRLEASLLRAANGEPEAVAEEPAPAAAQAQMPAEMPAPPAVPVEPVTTAALAAPEAQQAAPVAGPVAGPVAAPEGAMAAASEALLAGDEPPPLPEPKPDPQAKPATPAAEAPKTAAEGAAAEQAADPVVALVLHLSSLRSEEAAKRQWSSLQQSFPEPLGPLQAEFRRTDLGDKGTFYRVLAGPLTSRDNAAQVCAALKAKDASQYCRILPQEPKG